MKKNFLLLLSGIIILMSSCSKDDDISSARNASPASPPSGNDFVDFNIGSTYYKIQESLSATQYALGRVEISNAYNGKWYILYYMNVTCPGDMLQFTIKVPADSIHGPGQYTFPLNFMDMTALDRSQSLYISTSSSMLTINIQSLDDADGGKIQGSFSLTNVQKTTSSHVITQGLSITNGKILATFE